MGQVCMLPAMTAPRNKRKDEIAAELVEAQARIQELEAATRSLRQEQTVMLSARVPRSLREQAKFLGLRLGKSMQEVTQEALAEWVEARTEQARSHSLFDVPGQEGTGPAS